MSVCVDVDGAMNDKFPLTRQDIASESEEVKLDQQPQLRGNGA